MRLSEVSITGVSAETLTASEMEPTLSVMGTFKVCSVSRITSAWDLEKPGLRP